MTGIPVLAAPAIDPGSARIEVTLPEGLTIGEIVAMVLPGAAPADRARARVTLVSPRGSAMILPEHWHAVRPRPGVRVVIRLVPGKDALRTILSVVVSIAAVALGTMFGPALAGALGWGTGAAAVGTATALIGIGVNLLGSLLINALIPPVKPDDERRNSYSISGWRNRLDPDGAVPVVLGQVRYAPPFAVRSHTEIVGDAQYIRAVFCFGEGAVGLSDFRIGDTSLADFDDVDIEVREGRPTDLPLSLFPRQIVEESIGVELTRPLPRDNLGEVIAGSPAIETPVVRTTGPDAQGASIIIAFPTGLISFSGKVKKQHHGVSIRVEQRLAGADEWQLVTPLDISARRIEAFYRQLTWSFPTRGRFQIRLTMMTPETEETQVQQRAVWAGLQTLRPEYPLAYRQPLALVAVRVRATHQLSGSLDNFSALAWRVCLDWDHVAEEWIERPTSNPASLYRYILQCPANPKPATDAEIDLGQLTDWHHFCHLRALQYNRVLDQAGTTLREVLTEVAAAGRASPRHDGTRWGVVIDRPAELIVDHINPRNSWGFSVRRAYVEKPHAWICKFQDEDNDYKEAQRVIRRPGYTGDITVTETLELPGITNAAIVYREGLRRFFEAEYRPDVFEATQEGALRVATRGDTAMLSHDVLSRMQWAGRVRHVSGSLVALDELVTMVEGRSYALRFRVFADDEDTVGTSVVRPVATLPGEETLLTLTGSGPVPLAGDIVHFGEMGTDSYPVVVTHIEATQDQCQIIRAVAAAPEIDALTNAAEVPAWSGRVGVELGANLLQPSAPRFTSITSGISGTGEAGRIDFLIVPGSGAISAVSFRISHRLGTSGDWTEAVIPVAAGGGSILVYGSGSTAQITAQALSWTGVAGPWTTPVTVIIGAGDAPIPAALDDETISITTLLGGALIQLATGPDANTTQIQLYRSTSAVLDRETDAVGGVHAVSPLQSFSFALGDTTRSNLVTGGTMDAPAAWDLDPGWAIAAGLATHTAGTAGAIGQARAFEAGKWYRLGYIVSGRTAGGLTPRLTGGSDRPGTSIAANGFHRDRIQAVTGNDRIEWLAGTSFDGAIDDVIVYLETGACLAQDIHYIWIEPQNDDGVPGPVSGPFTIVVI
ncbi:TipJ family phage tail tip protein [Pseudotabrizicola algicola]|uniref:Phage tail protein n=1 Tax=Pseudotabrizicola algicola TaxID=2709381 RepID=A0A6B3RQQ9_9RHOB|nr:phage tail protein [Pseudotabrizicola algicola]NEX47593.1 phage tail protein [Pseudotabrizicola algicola]